MKFLRIILLIGLATIFAQCPDFSEPGEFATSYRTIDEIDTPDERMTNSRCYYPSSGDGVDPVAAPCPVISFGHGFMTSEDNYYSYAEHYASWGYICILPTFSNPFLFPNHDMRARLLIYVAQHIRELNSATGDIFEGNVDVDRIALIGHSMGGSVSLLAGDMYVNDPEATFHLGDTLKAIIAFGSPQSNPSTDPANITTPYMFLSATEDNIAPWDEVRSDLWVGSSAPGAFAVIDGGNHTFFTDEYGHYFTDGTATIERAEQLAIARAHSTAFLEMYIREDTSFCVHNFVYGDSIIGAPWIDTAETRYIPLEIEEKPIDRGSLDFEIFPNPFHDRLHINLPGDMQSDVFDAEIYDIRGILVERISESMIWKPSKKTPAGSYIIKIGDGKSSLGKKVQYIY